MKYATETSCPADDTFSPPSDIQVANNTTGIEGDLTALDLGITSPIHKLPNDILSDIFGWCTPFYSPKRPEDLEPEVISIEEGEEISWKTSPLNIMHVCHWWHSVAIKKPTLFRQIIHIGDSGIHPRFIFATWLANAGNLPLDICIHLERWKSDDFAKSTCPAIIDNFPRIRTLILYDITDVQSIFREGWQSVAPQLKYLRIHTQKPMLRGPYLIKFDSDSEGSKETEEASFVNQEDSEPAREEELPSEEGIIFEEMTSAEQGDVPFASEEDLDIEGEWYDEELDAICSWCLWPPNLGGLEALNLIQYHAPGTNWLARMQWCHHLHFGADLEEYTSPQEAITHKRFHLLLKRSPGLVRLNVGCRCTCAVDLLKSPAPIELKHLQDFTLYWPSPRTVEILFANIRLPALKKLVLKPLRDVHIEHYIFETFPDAVRTCIIDSGADVQSFTWQGSFDSLEGDGTFTILKAMPNLVELDFSAIHFPEDVYKALDLDLNPTICPKLKNLSVWSFSSRGLLYEDTLTAALLSRVNKSWCPAEEDKITLEIHQKFPPDIPEEVFRKPSSWEPITVKVHAPVWYTDLFVK